MRRRALLVLAVSIGLLTSNVSFAAAPKAGAKCTKAGATTVSKDLKFTCIKKGKNLVWSAGVKIVKTTPTPTATPTPTVSPTTTPTASGITKAVVAQHNSKSDCWSYVDNKVYNFTLWIKEHPGGEEVVISMCGTNGADLLRGHHGTEVDSYLAPYLLGELK